MKYYIPQGAIVHLRKENMRKPVVMAFAITLFALFMSSASAICPSGELLIDPHGSYYPLPIMLTSPATFTIESANITTGIFPNIVLVMTKASFDGLIGPVIVDWIGTSGQSNQSIFPKMSFQAVTTGYVPDQTVTPFDSGRYSVSDLKQHLGVNGTQEDTLFYNFGPFLGGSAIGRIPREFIVTLPSTHPRMLVLAIARSGVCTPFFNMRVGPCRPGFIVPEPASVLLVTASIVALGLFAIKRREQ
jgi:hypothetical protein